MSLEPNNDFLAALLGDLTDDDFQRAVPSDDLLARLNEVPTQAVVPIQPNQHQRRSRLARVAPWVLAAAATIALIVVAFRPDSKSSGVEVAAAALTNEGLPREGSRSDGTAHLVNRDGQAQLDIELKNLPSVSGHLEVWLIDTQVQRMYSLGAVPGTSDTSISLVVPPGVSWSDFPVVDVSIEPNDGLPVHSGVSILRGVLSGA